MAKAEDAMASANFLISFVLDPLLERGSVVKYGFLSAYSIYIFIQG